MMKKSNTAELAKAIDELIAILPTSYTQETASNLLKTYGLEFKHQEMASELLSCHSIYKQLLMIPALVIHNQNVVIRVIMNRNHIQEQLTNISYSVTATKANHPEIEEPLSPKRKQDFEVLEATSNMSAAEAEELARKHDVLRDGVFEELYQDIYDWRSLCYDTALDVTTRLNENGYDLPPNFTDIFRKHLELPSINQLDDTQLTELGLSKQSKPEEIALAIALKEVKKYDRA